MGHIAVSRHFNAPPDKVWSVISDLEHAAEHIEAIKKVELVTDGPVGKGSRIRETRVMFGKEATEEMEVTEWDPPNQFALECESCGAHMKAIMTCKPDGDGTRVEMSMHTKPITFFAKLMLPLSKMMEKSCRKAFEKDLDDLQQVLGDNVTSPQPA